MNFVAADPGRPRLGVLCRNDEAGSQEARKAGADEWMILFWISGFLLPFHGGMVAGLIFSTEQVGRAIIGFAGWKPAGTDSSG